MHPSDNTRLGTPTSADLTAPVHGSTIAAGRVNGTAVYDNKGDRVGSIEDIMLDKSSGKVTYAVLSFGGFLGIGSKHYPLPWEMLHYDVDLGGYRVDLDRERLEGAPVYDDDTAWTDDSYGRRVREHWGYPYPNVI
jgi:sporulation protein YlmC with PRC-barrel domain